MKTRRSISKRTTAKIMVPLVVQMPPSLTCVPLRRLCIPGVFYLEPLGLRHHPDSDSAHPFRDAPAKDDGLPEANKTPLIGTDLESRGLGHAGD